MIRISDAEYKYGLHPQTILALFRRGLVYCEDRRVKVGKIRTKRWYVREADLRGLYRTRLTATFVSKCGGSYEAFYKGAA